MSKSSVNTPSTPATVDTLTARGRKTRDALLDAARKVFETVGFPDTRVEHIAQERTSPTAPSTATSSRRKKCSGS